MHNLLESSITFRKCTQEKLAFILLNLFDLGLTVFAAGIGAQELNPIMNRIIDSPVQIFSVKVVIPVLLAWLLPGKILVPSVILLGFVVSWNAYQLAAFYF